MRITIGAPVTGADFFPRDDVIAALERGLEVEHILFLAPRRTGKTSLLKQVVKQPPSEAKAIYINVEKFIHPKDWITRMAKELAKHRKSHRALYSVANYDLYITQAKLIFIFINHKLIIKHAIEFIVLN